MRFSWILALMGPLLLSAESEEEALFLRRIADFWQEGEYKIAKSQMEEFISEYPENSFSDPLCAALGDLYLREKNFSQALNYYSRIQTAEFSSRVFLSRMQCLYEMQWYATLADECQAYLEQGTDLHATYFLAIALYHQCLNAAKEPEALQGFAERAKPLFEALFASELSDEVAQGYAHLCFILKDFPKAAQIYLDLAKDPASKEEMLFQAALIQSEYDKKLAIETFAKVVDLDQKRAKEAAYNKLALSFDVGHYEDVAQGEALVGLPIERMGVARLFVGRSLVNLKKFPEAILQLKAYIEEAPPSEMLHAAILSLIDAAYQCADLKALDQAITKLTGSYPNDPELPKAYFSRAQILKKYEQLPTARAQLEEIIAKFPEFPQKAQVLFELAHMDYKGKRWDSCYKNTSAFLAQFRTHELALFAQRYQISSMAEMAKEKPELRKTLAADLEKFIEQASDGEKAQWKQVLAKTYYELKDYEKATALLQDTPNDRLLAAFCHRDAQGDLKLFSEMAGSALSEGADLIDPNQVRFALFNAHLELSEQVEAADHLYAAFEAGAEVRTENLFWLADLYYNRLSEAENDFALANRAAVLFERIQKKTKGAPDTPVALSESALCKLAKVYSILGRTDEAIVLLEERTDNESKLILAESYAKQGAATKACELFDAIVTSCGTMRNIEGASACLQGAMLKIAKGKPDLAQIATQLKNLTIQKNFEGEPVYLEAALEYIELQSKSDPAKRIALLNKTKQDFETRDDLLSKDYHEARVRSPRKSQMYQGYMQLMDAMSLAASAEIDSDRRNDLQTKSKELLLQIVKEQQAAPLIKRARMYLTRANELKETQ